MSIITANTLFQFTKEKETLFKILENGFRPNFSPEFGPSTGGRIRKAEICMSCFCDLPLSSIEKHTNGYKWEYNGAEHEFAGYGKYGLGMSKEWGVANGLNPVTYTTNTGVYLTAMLHANTTLLNLSNYFNNKLKGLDVAELPYEEKEPFVVRHDIMIALETQQIALSYLKPYKDEQTGMIYYNEREWRATIPYSNTSNYEIPVIFPEQYPELLEKKQEYLKIVETKYMLTFEQPHIKYIIVKDEDDIEDIVSFLYRLPQKYTSSDVAKLTTRILTCKQIHEDF